MRVHPARAVPTLLLMIAVAIGVAACGGGAAPAAPASSAPLSAVLPSAPPSGPQSLSETGSTLLYPLFNDWAQAYEGQFANVKLHTDGTGSSTGVSSAAGGTADLGASDAYLSSAEAVRYPALENIPLAIAAQMINYNVPDVAANLKLDSAVLADMYQGTITRWNDQAIRALNPGVPLPGLKIVPIHRSGGSGDTFLFTSYLSQPGSAWASSAGFSTTVAWPPVPGALAEPSNMSMVSACKAHPGCVAYIGISYMSQTSGSLGEAQLLNGSGRYVLPDAASISAEAADFAANTPANGVISLMDGFASGGYPIVNYEYAIVSTRQPSSQKAATIRAFLNWVLTDGSSSAYLSRVGFQPLPSQVLAIADTLIAKVG